MHSKLQHIAYSQTQTHVCIKLRLRILNAKYTGFSIINVLQNIFLRVSSVYNNFCFLKRSFAFTTLYITLSFYRKESIL